MSTWDHQRYPIATCDEVHLAHVIGCSGSGDGIDSSGCWSGVDDWFLTTGVIAHVAVVLGSHLESLGMAPRLRLSAFRN